MNAYSTARNTSFAAVIVATLAGSLPHSMGVNPPKRGSCLP
jgi:hypothetical protein